jgi:triosephosphate isomerase
LIASKVNTALEHDMTVIFCFGEELKDRQSANHFNVVENQLKDGLFNIQASDWGNVVLAYEPVWAIEPVKLLLQNKHKKCINSSGKQFVRHTETISQKKYPSFTEEEPENAKEIFSKPDVDGGLIGGAALKSDDFVAIVNAI